jgi:hypothetical protein
MRRKSAHDGDEIFGYDFIESVQQVLDLFFDGRVETILSRELDELALIFLCNWDSFTIFLQWNDTIDTKLDDREFKY